MSQDLKPFIFIGAILLISLVVLVFSTSMHKKIIRESLEKKGAKVIDIFWIPIDFDKSNHNYQVIYQDADGKQHNRTCKMHVLGSAMFWEDEE
jgi:hypothetical protein